ncbi:c-type cytochrome [Moritella viscosa]|uniref:Nitric oxide reductase subunit C-NOR small subunit-Nitric oxide reductase cytochrome c subunit n=1 Tax=Moritella viscosa TaxID=80854 RepID=A0A1L0C814_9GAMM|nr:cytochrome c [Moritella viscosa]SGZ01753.1 Nitric oxide reductase subunit C-NOR small subunit-Nitric oxide reductase cytochrome c subunit [Moritella viscosa]SGZ08749.1 Nitric oxide reductase subunit C-NOR small subunit-Nitric oxide reductase cytochrome c subunit [Moritella viscosa]SGZ10367.1 Nitric oxide reductase subunit C-NOR small subunit-Nitric oxide reductase cytochrome c subunit [Moritella viscosa]SGZ15500.1 Nitric oxide reductase subunit C-NOR small subunit-Nitric oxide reductase cyto
MSDNFTKGMARNIYYGGSVFFFLLLMGLTFDTMLELPERDHRENITEAVAHGKELWENNNCIGCHSLMGEGAYFAPELGNVFVRYGNGNEETFEAFMQSWMAMQPLRVPNRRQMPQFNLSEEDVHDISKFLIWTSRIDNNNWPPNKQG